MLKSTWLTGSVFAVDVVCLTVLFNMGRGSGGGVGPRAGAVIPLLSANQCKPIISSRRRIFIDFGMILGFLGTVLVSRSLDI